MTRTTTKNKIKKKIENIKDMDTIKMKEAAVIKKISIIRPKSIIVIKLKTHKTTNIQNIEDPQDTIEKETILLRPNLIVKSVLVVFQKQKVVIIRGILSLDQNKKVQKKVILEIKNFLKINNNNKMFLKVLFKAIKMKLKINKLHILMIS